MTDAMIPEERFQKEVERRKTAEEQRKALTEQVAELTTQIKTASKERDQFAAQVEGIGDLRSELEKARAELTANSTTSSAHISMLEAGVSKQSVRDLALFQHQQHVKAEGDSAQAWGDWWEGNRAELLADFQPAAAQAPVQEQAPAEPQAQQAPGRPQPQVNNGAQPTPAPAQNYVPGSISNMSLDDFKANKAAILSDISGPWIS